MKIIDKIVEERIKSAASVVDVLQDLGVELHRSGAEYEGLCPFHEDHHYGSFKVNVRGNYYKCFSCRAKGDAIKALMELKNMDYPTALRWLASKYGIYVDDEPVPVVKKAAPRKNAVDNRQVVSWDIKVAAGYIHNGEENNLMNYIYSLPMRDEHKAMLHDMSELYAIGTSKEGWTKGYTIWWQIDDQNRVRTAKLMKYKEDGHRDKGRYSNAWMHCLMGVDSEKYKIKQCLFGLHLVDCFPKAEVCIVESEKTALICSAFCDPNERIWMATGGLSNLKEEFLKPLIERKRYIVLFPDHDGLDEWKETAKSIKYNRMSISKTVQEQWRPIDGEKADIADIMIRTVCGIQETDAQKACRRLGVEDEETQNAIAQMIDKLNLELN